MGTEISKNIDSETIALAYQKHQHTSFANLVKTAYFPRPFFLRGGLLALLLSSAMASPHHPPSRCAGGGVASPLRSRSAGPLRGAAATAADLFPSTHPPPLRRTQLFPLLYNCHCLSSANGPKHYPHGMPNYPIRTNTNTHCFQWKHTQH